MGKSLGDRFFGIVKLWWRHRISFAISVVVTLTGLFIYYRTFLGEQPLPFSDFVSRLEFDSLDLRFQLRGKWKTDPRIIIVGIDQHTEEELGHWPFSKHYFAQLVDKLREDGARVVAFDITFFQPDATAAPLRDWSSALEAQKKKGQPTAPGLLEELTRRERAYDYDNEFAEAIQRFGGVVLGNYFILDPREVQGISPDKLDHYANNIAFFTFPQVRPTSSAKGPEGYKHFIDL